MFYKFSNTAAKEIIEKEFDVTFEFGKLYAPSPMINGLEESNLPIITIDDPKKIKIGIWGMLPQDLEDNWKVFQNMTNTLNINIENIDIKNSLYSEALDQRRCIIIVTGFFTSALHNGKMFPYHVYVKDHKPFAIAGIYNQLDDGFITCSILIDKIDKASKNIPNMLGYVPLVLNRKEQTLWLNKSFDFENLKEHLLFHKSPNYLSHPVPKEFFDNNIVLKDMLYDDMLNQFLRTP